MTRTKGHRMATRHKSFDRNGNPIVIVIPDDLSGRQSEETRAEQNRIDALIAMPEMSIKVLWDKVVERGIGLNYKIHGMHAEYQGPMAIVKRLK